MSKDDTIKNFSFYWVLTTSTTIGILKVNLKAIHNKDYSVVKTFRAALSWCRPLLLLEKKHPEDSRRTFGMLQQFYSNYRNLSTIGLKYSLIRPTTLSKVTCIKAFFFFTNAFHLFTRSASVANESSKTTMSSKVVFRF